MMRLVRVTVGKLLAATLLILCIGVQVLEATGRWDRNIQDAGDEAVIVVVVLCIGTALASAGAVLVRLRPSCRSSHIVLTLVDVVRPAELPISGSFSASPPLSLRI